MPEAHQDTTATSCNDASKNGTLESPKNDVESTPCLDYCDAKNQDLPFYEHYIAHLQKKTGLSRKWVLIVCGLTVAIVILLLIIVGLLIGWPTIPHMFRFPICRTPECLRVAAKVQENLDQSISPCTDLWGAVCSKYAKNSSRPLDRPVWNDKEMLLQRESERIRDMIATLELPLQIGTVEWKLKHFYEACMNVVPISSDAATPLTNIISELGGWYILRDWNGEDFDGMQLLTMLQVRYGISPFFKVHVEPDPHVPDSHSIRISPAGLGLPDRDYYFRDSDDPVLLAYTNYIRDIVISLSSTRNKADRFAKDMFGYEKRIAEITPYTVSLQNPITTYNAISLAELKLTTNTIPFYDILQAMYPEVSISENTEVIVTSLEYLSQVAHVISTTDRQALNGYLMWCLVREYVPFLSETYSSAKDTFNNALYGTLKPLNRWEMCSRLMKKYMSFAVEYFLDKSYPALEEPRQVLNETFTSILQVVKARISKFDDTVLLKRHLETKVDTISMHIGLPDSIKSTQFTKEYYKALTILKIDLFECVKNAIVFQKKIEQKTLLKTLPENIFLKELVQPEVSYVPSKNAIVVPRILMLHPLFEDFHFRPVIYGRLGVEIASAVLSAVLPYGSLWTADKKILSPFHMTVNESVRSVRGGVDCFSRFISNLKLDLPIIRKTNKTVASRVLKELSAVKIAFEALQAASSTDHHKHYGGLEQYEEWALYFINFAQTKCSCSTQEYKVSEKELHFLLPSRSILDIAWAQLPDFRNALGCGSSKSTCDVF